MLFPKRPDVQLTLIDRVVQAEKKLHALSNPPEPVRRESEGRQGRH
jgi:hypothetical protein